MSKQIRLWKVGYICPENPLNSLIPNKEMIEKIKNLIRPAADLPPGGVLDIVWGPELNVELITIDDDVESYIVNEQGKLEKA